MWLPSWQGARGFLQPSLTWGAGERRHKASSHLLVAPGPCQLKGVESSETPRPAPTGAFLYKDTY